jgi:hypothetical protein
MIFYAIYKNQQTCKHYWSYAFARRPLERFGNLQCSPWAPASGGPAKSGQPPAGVGRARAGEGPWVLGDRFRGSDGAGRRPARWGASGQARWPPRPAVPAWWGSAGRPGMPASSVRCKGRWGTARFGAQPAGARSSLRRAPMAGTGGEWGRGLARCRGAAPLYGGLRAYPRLMVQQRRF